MENGAWKLFPCTIFLYKREKDAAVFTSYF